MNVSVLAKPVVNSGGLRKINEHTGAMFLDESERAE